MDARIEIIKQFISNHNYRTRGDYDPYLRGGNPDSYIDDQNQSKTQIPDS